MASYRMINQALSGVESTLKSFAEASGHFLHESLKQIAMRSRERDTMPQLFTQHRFLGNNIERQPVAPVAAPIVPQSRPVGQNPSMSADILAELSQTPVKSKQLQPRPAFMRNDESNDQGYDFSNTPRFK